MVSHCPKSPSSECGVSGKKHGHVVFDALYDSDVVEEDAFMKWKEDEGEQITNIGGKSEVLLQTASWYQWLETAEEAS